jgi:hypothetical protein
LVQVEPESMALVLFSDFVLVRRQILCELCQAGDEPIADGLFTIVHDICSLFRQEYPDQWDSSGQIELAGRLIASREGLP